MTPKSLIALRCRCAHFVRILYSIRAFKWETDDTARHSEAPAGDRRISEREKLRFAQHDGQQFPHCGVLLNCQSGRPNSNTHGTIESVW